MNSGPSLSRFWAVSSGRWSRFSVRPGMARSSDTGRKTTTCAVPDRNGGRSTASGAHRPAEREAGDTATHSRLENAAAQ